MGIQDNIICLYWFTFSRGTEKYDFINLREIQVKVREEGGCICNKLNDFQFLEPINPVIWMSKEPQIILPYSILIKYS